MLAPVVRGGAAGVRALLKRAAGIEVTNSLAKTAERFLRRQVDLEEASPFDAAPAARAEHAAHLSEAQVALREDRPARHEQAARPLDIGQRPTRPSCSPAPICRTAKLAKTDYQSVILSRLMAGSCRFLAV